MSKQPAVLFIGKAGHREFFDALECLRGQGELVVQSTVGAAVTWLKASGLQPATVVLGTARRGEHSVQELLELERQVPLANMIALVGSWCEGETRSGKPANGWRRVYWHQFPRCAASELMVGHRQTAGGEESRPLRLPKTITENERALALSKRALPAGQGRIAINTRRQVDYEALANACQAAGYGTCWCQDACVEIIAEATCVLWDRRGLQGNDLLELTSWREQWGELPVIATIGFPRTQDYQLVSQGIVQEIVGKPFLLGELLTALQAVGESQPTVEQAA